MNSICAYVRENNLGINGLIDLCSKSKEELSEEMKGAWCKIAESMPQRSVQSCHNFCRRKFNPNNYNGKWTEDEEMLLVELVKERGHAWKDIAQIINFRSERGNDEVDVRFGRTPENVKDKWKQLGGDNINYRKRGPWTIKEAIELFQAICKATDAKLIKGRKDIHYLFEEEQQNRRRVVIEEDDIYIYDKYVELDEVLPHIIKKNRCKKLVPSLSISWTAIQNHIKNRSVDDIRNFWNLKLLPQLVPARLMDEWTEEDDTELLKNIY